MLQAALIVAYGGFLESASPCKALKFELKQSCYFSLIDYTPPCYGVVESNKYEKMPSRFFRYSTEGGFGGISEKNTLFLG